MSISLNTLPPGPLQLETPPRIIKLFTVFLCFYLAAPVLTVPIIGLSLSAPAIFFLFFEVMRRMGGFRFKRAGVLLGLLAFIWFAQLLSLAVNEIFTDYQVNLAVGLTTLYRYAFWMFVVFLSVRLFSTTTLPKPAVIAFGVGVTLLSFLVLAEFFYAGGLTELAVSKITGLTQNSYGWQFSAFLPCGLYLALIAPGRWRLIARGAFVLTLCAVMINGSRSSWITAVIGITIFLLLWSASSQKKIGAGKIFFAIIMLLVLAGGVFTLLPDRLKAHMQKRIVQSENLELDKSWQVRVVMVDKGKTIFMDNPLFGVGPGQFRFTRVELNLPDVLASVSEEALNRKSSHNSYIQLLAEGGLMLMVPYLLMLSYLLLQGLKSAVYLARQGETWGIPVIVGLVGFSIHFWSISGFTSTAPWFLYGMVAAMIYRRKYIMRSKLNITSG